MEWYVVGLLNARCLGKIGDSKSKNAAYPLVLFIRNGFICYCKIARRKISLDGGNFISASCGDSTISGMTDEGIGRRSISLSN